MVQRKHKFDTGWAWAVAGGCFIMGFVIVSWIRVQGFLFVEIQDLTGASTTEVSWASVGMSMAWHFMAPFSALLAVKFGTRRTVAVGACLLSLIQSSGFFIRHISGFIAQGICAGIAGSLCYVPSIVFLSHYFRRRLGIATALPAIGSSVSQFVMAPLCAYLIETYGLPGTYLIFGGVSLHLLITAATFFPVDGEELRLADEEYQAELKEKQDAKTKAGNDDKADEVEQETAVDELIRNEDDYDFKKSQLSIAEIDVNASMTSLHQVNTAKQAPKEPSKLLIAKRLFADPLLWIMMPTYSFGIMASLAAVRYSIPYVINEHGISMKDVSMFLAFSGIPGIICRFGIGFAADLDCVKTKLQRYRLWTVGVAMMVLICVLLVLFKSYYEFLFVYLLMGCSGGFFHILGSVTTFDLLGRENYAVGFGLLNLASGVTAIFDSMVVARLKDITGSFHASFLLNASILVVSAMLLLIGVPIVQMRRRRAKSSDIT